MAKKQNENQPTKESTSLQFGIIYPGAAGIDVGSMNMMVSYPDGNNIQTVKEYGAYTEDLYAMVNQLQEAGVTHVCMEATGVYWMSAYELLVQFGFNVTVVNARHYKNVAGHKTDVKDCQWLQQLHAHGLLKASHIADEQSRELRTYIHERNLNREKFLSKKSLSPGKMLSGFLSAKNRNIDLLFVC